MKIQLIGSKRFNPFISIWKQALTEFDHECGFSITNPDVYFVFNFKAYIGNDSLKQIKEIKKAHPRLLMVLESWGKGNGINHNHHSSIIKFAKENGIWGKPSPIDTFYPHFFDVWQHPADIFGPASKKRSEAVIALQKKVEELLK